MIKVMDLCQILGCTDLAKAPRGWCWRHYGKWRRHGDPNGEFVQPPCSVDECERLSRSGGMCDLHYRRWKRHGDASIVLLMRRETCTVDNCGKAAFGRGLCNKHYYQMWINAGGRAKKAAALARRRAHMAGSPAPGSQLSWVAFWQRGTHQCHLCGVGCDPSDFVMKINRAGREQKICGPRYPSLDHIIPLSKGGEHTEANTALACMSCNRRKCAKGTGHEAEYNGT